MWTAGSAAGNYVADEDFIELIDKAVTEGQIDSLKADLVRSLMHASSLSWAEQRESDVVRFVVPENW